MLVGQGMIADRAVGEDVEIGFGDAPGVRTNVVVTERKAGRAARRDYAVTVTNDGAAPGPYEAEIANNGVAVSSGTRLGRRNGRPLWQVTIPPNGRADCASARLSSPRCA